jgi:phosphoribosylpyrophosphate synthetase
MSGDQLKVFCGSANPELAQAICAYLGTTPSPAEVGRFNDGTNIFHQKIKLFRAHRRLKSNKIRFSRLGEIKVQIQTNVRGCDVFVRLFHPFRAPRNDL